MQPNRRAGGATRHLDEAIEAAVVNGYGADRQALELAQRVSRATCETILKLKPRIFG